MTLRDALFKAIQFENKTAHAAAFLLSSPHVDNPHAIDKGMLGNLLYLAERCCIATYGQLLFMDPPTADPDKGIILTNTAEILKGGRYAQPESAWHWFNLESDSIHLNDPIIADHLDELSKADVEILQSLQDRFLAKSPQDLARLTRSLPEWPDTGTTAIIPWRDIIFSCGYSFRDAACVLEAVSDQLGLASIIAD